MLHDLDQTLDALLKLELPDLFIPEDDGTPITISFETPDQEFVNKVTLPAVDFFLYDVRENLELRTGWSPIERQSNGKAYKTRPPARVDCSYLITVWPSESDRNTIQTEHRLLGEIMKVLLRYRQIPDAVLQGSLQGSDPPIRAFSLHQSNLQSLGEFWQAMGGKPKAALNYTIILPVPIYEQEEVGTWQMVNQQ